MSKNYSVKSIGEVVHKKDGHFLIMDAAVRPALKEVGRFSHIIVLWWASQLDTPEYRNTVECELPYAPGTIAGLFATRSPIRPNPLLVTTCKVERIDIEQGLIKVNNIDAIDKSPVLDIKVYIPSCDRVEKPQVASWANEWGAWYPEEGLEVEDYS